MIRSAFRRGNERTVFLIPFTFGGKTECFEGREPSSARFRTRQGKKHVDFQTFGERGGVVPCWICGPIRLLVPPATLHPVISHPCRVVLSRFVSRSSDIDMESEAYRWLGSVRFTIGTAVRIASLKYYTGRITFLPAENVEVGGEGKDGEGGGSGVRKDAPGVFHPRKTERNFPVDDALDGLAETLAPTRRFCTSLCFF